MKNQFIEDVYASVMGSLLEEYRIPGVKNVFATGEPCDLYYEKVYYAYERLQDRLNAGDDDPDCEIIINSLLRICEEVGYEMYRCGAMFCRQEEQK